MRRFLPSIKMISLTRSTTFQSDRSTTLSQVWAPAQPKREVLMTFSTSPNPNSNSRSQFRSKHLRHHPSKSCHKSRSTSQWPPKKRLKRAPSKRSGKRSGSRVWLTSSRLTSNKCLSNRSTISSNTMKMVASRSFGLMLTRRTMVLTCIYSVRFTSLRSSLSYLAPSKFKVWRELSLPSPR